MSDENASYANKRIAKQLDALEAAERKGMVPTSYGDLGSLSPPALGASINWDQWLFKPDASPHAGRASPPSVSYHVGDADGADLLRFEYTFEGNPLVVVESPDYTLTLLPGSGEAMKGMDPPTRIFAIRRLALQIFKTWVEALPWQQRSPSSADDSAAFTTNPARNPFSVSWFDQRMDAGVWKGHVYFFFYRQMKSQSMRPNPRFFGHLAAENP